MRVFVTGASGAIGSRLVPQLIARLDAALSHLAHGLSGRLRGAHRRRRTEASRSSPDKPFVGLARSL
jgi:nucleoside-diphosphate-sugar epimerase